MGVNQPLMQNIPLSARVLVAVAGKLTSCPGGHGEVTESTKAKGKELIQLARLAAVLSLSGAGGFSHRALTMNFLREVRKDCWKGMPVAEARDCFAWDYHEMTGLDREDYTSNTKRVALEFETEKKINHKRRKLTTDQSGRRERNV